MHMNMLVSSLCEKVCIRAITSVRHLNGQHRGAASVSFSPHRPAGRRVAACLTAHCACPRHLPWLLDVGGGEGLQQGREDPSGITGEGWKERQNTRKGRMRPKQSQGDG